MDNFFSVLRKKSHRSRKKKSIRKGNKRKEIWDKSSLISKMSQMAPFKLCFIIYFREEKRETFSGKSEEKETAQLAPAAAVDTSSFLLSSEGCCPKRGHQPRHTDTYLRSPVTRGPCNLPEFLEEDWLRAGNSVPLPQKEGREKAQNHLTQYVTHSSVLVKSEFLCTHAHLPLQKQ